MYLFRIRPIEGKLAFLKWHVHGQSLAGGHEKAGGPSYFNFMFALPDTQPQRTCGEERGQEVPLKPSTPALSLYPTFYLHLTC